MIESGIIDVFDEEGVNYTLEQVDALNEWWIPRGMYGGEKKGFAPSEDTPIDFYTIGPATYLDRGMVYDMIKEETQEVIRDWFDWTYETLVYCLWQEIGPCVISSELGAPGFHVFSAKPGEPSKPASKEYLERPVATIHFDEQQSSHQALWDDYIDHGATVDLENCLSFTLCFAAPKNGCGLSTWGEESVKCYDLNDDYSKHVKSLVYGGYGSPDAVIPYTPGKLFYFIGPLKHQMSPGFDLGENDRRITLQGHGVKVNDVWELYF